MVSKRGKIVDIKRRPEAQGQLLERLFREHEPALRAFMQLRLGSREDREDIVQDTFYRLARIDGLADKLQNHSSPRAYLFAIASNLLVDHLRKRAVRSQDIDAVNQPSAHAEYDSESAELSFDISPESVVAATRELEQVKKVLRRMTPTCRTAFVLKRFHHLSGREIARRMGISESRVDKYIARTMRALRDGMVRR